MTIRRSGMLLCLIGPAGSGKTTLSTKLLTEFGDTIARSTSVTSRPPRQGEVDGKSYHFVTRDRFDAMCAAGEFFESEEIHGNRYGTLRRTLDEAISSGRDLVLDIDIRGALNFKAHYPLNTVNVFIVPPSPAILRSRVEQRGSITPEELARRLETARSEYARVVEISGEPNKIDYLVLNDQLDHTFAQIVSIVRAERARLARLDGSEIARLCRVDG